MPPQVAQRPVPALKLKVPAVYLRSRAIGVTAVTSTKPYDGNVSSPDLPSITSGSLATGAARLANVNTSNNATDPGLWTYAAVGW